VSEPATQVPSRPPWLRRRTTMAQVERMIERLQPAGGPTALSTSALAQLRRGVGRAPGSVPEIWPWTMDGLESTAKSDRPSPEETAVHHALTLFAVHQQSRDTSMNESGRTFGRAVRLLADRAGTDHAIQESPVYRRFTAMATANGFSELVVHARGLIGQLRAEKIGFAYPAFAGDLCDLATSWASSEVRRRWSRDFYARPTADPSGDDHNDSHEGD
jgi:CRISPR system Cascade subunit CasB